MSKSKVRFTYNSQSLDVPRTNIVNSPSSKLKIQNASQFNYNSSSSLNKFKIATPKNENNLN